MFLGGLEHLRIVTSFFGINFLFIIRGKTRVTENMSMGVGVIIISESLNGEKEGSKLLVYTGFRRVEIIVSLAAGLVVTPEALDLVRRERNQRT